MHNAEKLFIKGMVCNRCIRVIETELEQLGIHTVKVSLGEVTIITPHRLDDAAPIAERLSPLGFELIEDKKLKVVKEVKAVIGEVLSGDYDFPQPFRLSDLLSKRLDRDYVTISSIFSLLEQKSIETYFIESRIEKVKEFLVYGTASLSDIAFRLNFSSVPHLSKQFKQVTGLNTTHFKKIQDNKEVEIAA